MSKRKKKISTAFLIGIFVLLSTALITVIIIWLGASHFLQDNVNYVTYFDGSVEGLEMGSPVKYQGVPIGTIKEIKVAPDGKLVEIIMQVQKKIAINDDLRVKSEIAGLAGGKFLQLYYPGKESIKMLYPKLSFKPPHRLIKSSPSGFEEIEIAMKEVMNNFRDLQVKNISDNTIDFLQSSTEFFKNQELYQIVSQLSEASAKISHILSRADSSKIIDNLEVTSAKFIESAEKLKKFADNLNDQLNGLAINKKVDNAIYKYDTVMNSAQKVINLVGYRAENSLISLTETLEELKSTNKQLKKTLKAFSETPSQIFLSEPPKKEK